MSIPSDLRRNFSIFLFVEDIDTGASLRAFLAMHGYEVFMFRDHETLLDRIKDTLPHLVVFEPKFLQTALSEFVDSCLKISSEILFLPYAGLDLSEPLSEYRDFNFIGQLCPGAGLDVRCLQVIDQTCLGLFFQYQNEELISKEQALIKKISVLENESFKKIDKEKINSTDISESFSVETEKSYYVNCKSKEDLQDSLLMNLEQKFLRNNQQMQALVLKFLPTVQSFVAIRSIGLELEKIKGIGARLEKEESQDLFSFLTSGNCPKQLLHLMQQGLGIQHFVGQVLIVNENIEAMFVFWLKSDQINMNQIKNEFSVFQLLYTNHSLQRKLAETDLRDPVTELEGRDFYFKKMNEEIARSRRLQKAVSILKVSIDHNEEIEQSFGVGHYNAVLRSIATLVKRTSRVNDFVCRTDENEISVVLPHCARKGAAIRAERVRRMIENHSFNLSGHRVTVSCGISEYPTLCGSAEDLEKTAQQAVQFIQEKGGNKVCLYRAVQDFRPDFDVPPI